MINETEEIIPRDHRSGYAAIFGLPNAGKSTLLNALLDTRLSITSARPQTTRQNVLGILNSPKLQVIFLDTPGMVKPKYALHKRMNKQIDSALSDADLLIMIVDVSAHKHPVDIDLQRIKASSATSILVLSKIDLIDRNKLLPLIELYEEWHKFNAIIPICALKEEGVDELKNEIEKCLPYSPPYYPKDMLTDQPEKFFVAELIRERIFRSFHEEIPYATGVLINSFKERPNGKDYIEAIIVVERDSQKGILIGAGGQKLKKVGSIARKAIEEFLGRPVYLDLRVRVRANWRRDENKLNQLGY